MQEPKCIVYVSADSKDQQQYQSTFIIRFLSLSLREKYINIPGITGLLNLNVNLSILSR